MWEYTANTSGTRAEGTTGSNRKRHTAREDAPGVFAQSTGEHAHSASQDTQAPPGSSSSMGA